MVEVPHKECKLYFDLKTFILSIIANKLRKYHPISRRRLNAGDGSAIMGV
jgi:hypothetical protein